ncbi:MAG: hypothetical protein RLZ10_197 [Bacteroidota bacterium]|jgi:hypothetical protein
MDQSKTINLSHEEFKDLTKARRQIEEKLKEPVSDSQAIQILSKIFISGDGNKMVLKAYQFHLKYDLDICPICKKEYFPATRAKKTCSTECRKILYKRKKHGLLPSNISKP